MDSSHITGEFGEFLVWAGAALFILLNIILALAVTSDCTRMRANGREPLLLNAFGWRFLTLLTGLAGFAVFWVVHHSSLRDVTEDRATTPMKTP